MKTITLIGLASAVALAAVAPAEARGGCGAGQHRSPRGFCVANGSHRTVYIEGRYYPHRGYWDGRRWRHDRYRYHHHWRYR